MSKSNQRVIGLDVHPDSFAGAIVTGRDPGSARVVSTSRRVELPELEQWATRKQATPLSLQFTPESGAAKTWKPDAAKLGLGVNVASTLDAAAKAGREDLAGQVSHMFSGAKAVQVQAIASTDDTRLKAYLKRQIAADVNRKPKNAQFLLLKGGGFGTHRDEPGRAVDIEASAAAVKEAWSDYLAASPRVAVPTGTPPPALPASGDRATAPSANGDRTTQGGATDSQQPTADSQPTAAATVEGPEAELSVKATPAAITAEAVAEIDGVLGAKSSFVNGTTSRLGNIRIAARHINGTLLKPGDVFSYNRIVGPRDEDGGYREAPILVRGRHDKGIAGGICQTSGTLFNAVLHSGLQIVERSCHSTPIGYLPYGLDATVSYGSLDFRFKNDTPAPVYVAATLNGRMLTFSLFGKHQSDRTVSLVRGGSSRSGAAMQTQHDRSKPAGYRRVVEHGSSGGHVTWYRIIKENGQVVHRDVISSHYSGSPGVVVVGTGAPKARPARRSAPGAAGDEPAAGGAPPTVPPVGALQ